MPHYKAPNSASPYWLDDSSFEYLLPAGSVPITDSEAAAMLAALAPVADPKAAIQQQITTLEQAQLLPRITREFMLLQFATVAAGQGIDPMTNIAYKKLKEFDDQIAALRGQL